MQPKRTWTRPSRPAQAAADADPGLGSPCQPGGMHVHGRGGTLFARFGLTGAVVDLDAAVAAVRAALDVTPFGHATWASLLINLGNTLRSRFERTRAPADLDAAVEASEAAVADSPTGHPARALCLHNLGGALRARVRPGQRRKRTGRTRTPPTRGRQQAELGPPSIRHPGGPGGGGAGQGVRPQANSRSAGGGGGTAGAGGAAPAWRAATRSTRSAAVPGWLVTRQRPPWPTHASAQPHPPGRWRTAGGRPRSAARLRRARYPRGPHRPPPPAPETASTVHGAARPP